MERRELRSSPSVEHLVHASDCLLASEQSCGEGEEEVRKLQARTARYSPEREYFCPVCAEAHRTQTVYLI